MNKKKVHIQIQIIMIIFELALVYERSYIYSKKIEQYTYVIISI